jgi:hypothetical protein
MTDSRERRCAPAMGKTVFIIHTSSVSVADHLIMSPAVAGDELLERTGRQLLCDGH